jgi:hypothetical protein
MQRRRGPSPMWFCGSLHHRVSTVSSSIYGWQGWMVWATEWLAVSVVAVLSGCIVMQSASLGRRDCW